ncbi:metalloregulator ArsR/SmtB family transcription factor [Parvibaculum sp.]|uniref:ArsR/SmtB family transcription factor n=1 Tax=Parvibaculum sp. TaxID=2024848 RepID=UPI0032109B34
MTGLRAAGEPTRLRLLAILAKGELTVTELTQILRQSQPRVSRHLKLMCEAGLLDRFREGSWVFYRRAHEGQGARLATLLTGLVPAGDLTVARDMERLEAVRALRADRAAAFFSANAEQWNRIRSLHVSEAKVEEALLELASGHKTGTLVDLGTGTGRILELIGAEAEIGIGIDLSPEMLGLARTHLEQAGVDHCSVRQGDLYDLPLQDETADLVTLHQVLHYLDDPAAAVAEAARVLKPGGRLLIADFAPHELDFLRDEQAHRRLGFTEDEVRSWLTQAGLEVREVRELPPEGGEEAKLTVVIYAADKLKTGAVQRRNATSGQTAGMKE